MNTIVTSIKTFLVLTILVGFLYPVFITIVAQVTMSHQANGSLIYENDAVVGVPLIAQRFKSDRYFWARPSAANYNPMPSAASNLGPTSATLQKIVQERREGIIQTHGLDKDSKIPSELLFASASGLDPHISPETAHFQLERVLKARNQLEHKEQISHLIDQMTQQKHCTLFGKPCVNVLLLNRALDSFVLKAD